MRRRLAYVVLVFSLAAGPGAAQTAAPGGPALPTVAACAWGHLPASLRTVLPRDLAREEQRFAASLKALPVAQRRRAELAFATGAAAYVYGMPTVLLNLTVSRFPVNLPVGVGRLATPGSRAVVAPNNDTLYTVSRLDLGSGPVMIDAPDTHGRYSVLQLLDSYSNVVGYVGAGRERDHAVTVALVPPGWTGSLPPGVTVLRSPTKLVWLLGRTLVDGPADLAAARAVMSEYSVTPLPTWISGTRGHEVVIPAAPRRPATTLPRGRAFWDALNEDLAADPPPPQDACALRAFARVGIGPGKHISDALLRRALTAAAAAGERLVGDAAGAIRADSERHHREWQYSAPDTGRFGVDYAGRAAVAKNGFAANTRAEAFYPRTRRDSSGRLLDGRHRYTVRFPAGGLPPVRAFWSLTMYDTQLFLVPNPLNRYAIGDRTKGLRYGRGHSLTIYVQHSPPPAALRSNWLPAPAGRFIMTLRLYEPKPKVYSVWRPPTVSRTPPTASTKPSTVSRIERATKASANSCLWVGPYTTKRGPRFNQAFPDSGAVYWTARYNTPPGARLRLSGRFAHARYQSLSSYGAATGGPVDSLNDISTKPNPGSVNPFKVGANRAAESRSYTVTVSSAPPPASPRAGAGNTLFAGVPGRSDQELIYRVYLSDRGRDLTGGVGLPSPQLSLDGGATLRGRAACAALHSSGRELEAPSFPRSLYKSLRDQPGKPPTFPAEKSVHWGAFYSVPYTIACAYRGICDPHPKRVGGQYSNADNNYVGAFLNRRFGHVLVLRGTLPVTPATVAGERIMGSGQMRYWSMCQNESFATTAGAGCIYDEQVPIDPRRRYVIVTSLQKDRPRNATARCGVGFVPWPKRGDGAGHPDDALLLIRNMLPSPRFRHAVQDTKMPGDERRVMGPYLPSAKYMSTRQFERLGCRVSR